MVGVAGNGQEAVEKAAKLKPDIISMDYEMPLLDGISAVKDHGKYADANFNVFIHDVRGCPHYSGCIGCGCRRLYE